MRRQQAACTALKRLCRARDRRPWRRLQCATPMTERTWQQPRLTPPVVRAQEGHPVRLLPLLVHGVGCASLVDAVRRICGGGTGREPHAPAVDSRRQMRVQTLPVLTSSRQHRGRVPITSRGMAAEVQCQEWCRSKIVKGLLAWHAAALSPLAAPVCCRPAGARSAAPARRPL